LIEYGPYHRYPASNVIGECFYKMNKTFKTWTFDFELRNIVNLLLIKSATSEPDVHVYAEKFFKFIENHGKFIAN